MNDFDFEYFWMWFSDSIWMIWSISIRSHWNFGSTVRHWKGPSLCRDMIRKRPTTIWSGGSPKHLLISIIAAGTDATSTVKMLIFFYFADSILVLLWVFVRVATFFSVQWGVGLLLALWLPWWFAQSAFWDVLNLDAVAAEVPFILDEEDASLVPSQACWPSHM